jgi:hypothetical protein
VKLPADLNDALVGLYRGWDLLERERFASSVIDFDLAEPGDVPRFDSRGHVLTELERLIEAIPQGEDPDGAHALARARLQASSAYLRALEDVDGVPFHDYVRATMGIEPALIPERHIRDAELQVRKALDSIPFSRSGFAAFRERFQTRTGENLKRQFEHFCGRWIRDLTVRIDARLDPSSIVVEFAEEDAYWKNWISGNVAEGEPIKLRINVHERHIWYQGAVEILVLHEYCGHAVQMALWHDAVRRQQMSSFFGVLTVHCPDQFLLEGLAESIAHVLPDGGKKLEKKSIVIREMQTYNLLVLNNVHVLANDRGLDEARKYARRMLPFTSDETIERELRDRTRHPLFRTYQYVYAPAKEAFVSALVPLDSVSRWRVLRRLYRTPMTPASVKSLLTSANAHKA